MIKLFLPLTIALFVVACGPRDVANGGRNGNGGGPGQQGGGGGSGKAKLAFTVQDDGERAETCPTKNQDFKNVIVSEDDLEGVLDGTIKAVIEPGNRNCFRVGSIVQLKTDFSSDESQGDVIVVKTEGIALSKLAKKHAEAFGLTVGELKARGQELIDEIEAQKKFRPEGMVNITYFKIAGASDDDGNVKNTETQLSTTVYTKAGERPSSCTSKSKWTRISIPAEQDANLQSGKVIAWYSPGDKNCFEVGSEIEVKEQTGPARGILKVTRIEVVPVAQLSALHALAMNLKLEDVKLMVNQDEELINLIFFDYLRSPSVQELLKP
jgi:uncharacterized protein YqfB (UPF0267 family)